MRRAVSMDDSGASAVEYGLLVAAIAGVIVVIVMALGSQVVELFDRTCDEVTSQVVTDEDCD